MKYLICSIWGVAAGMCLMLALVQYKQAVCLRQPYALTVQNITTDLEELCTADPNCLDIASIEEAIKRKETK